MKNRIYMAIAAMASLAAMTLVSCSGNDAKKAFKPDITGRAGEVLAVLSRPDLNDTVGGSLRAVLHQQYLGLPTDEPIFEMSAVTPQMFNSDVNMHKLRNIVIVEIADTVSADTIAFYKDSWARQQAVVKIDASASLNAADVIVRNQNKIVSFFAKAERDRLIKYYGRIKSGANINDVKQTWGVNLVIPNMFEKCKPARKTEVSWYMSDTEEYSDGLIVYSYPYTGPESMTKEALVAHRDTILKANIIGPHNSRMCTETRYGLDELVYKYGEKMQAGHDVAELRGLWRMDGAAMGGPFIMRAVLDQEHDRVLVTDGYVYFPRREMKRNHIRQLEAIMYTLSF